MQRARKAGLTPQFQWRLRYRRTSSSRRESPARRATHSARRAWIASRELLLPAVMGTKIAFLEGRNVQKTSETLPINKWLIVRLSRNDDCTWCDTEPATLSPDPA